MRMRKHRKKRKAVQQSDLGRIVDQPIEQFKKDIVEQKVSIGVISNLILLLEATYSDMRSRKDQLINLVFKKEKTNDEVHSAIEGLYAEMTKIEQKVVFLKERHKELLKSVEVNNTV